MIRDALIRIFGETPIGQFEAVRGGDIGSSYKVTIDGISYFCKHYTQDEGYEMASAEKSGLQTLAQAQCIATPRVIACEPLERGGLLVLEYISEGRQDQRAMQQMGYQLAALHQLDQPYFGAKEDNFIGRLEQRNCCSENWPDFYCHYRLLPQYHKALNNDLLTRDEVPDTAEILRVMDSYTRHVSPSLLHGDLWNGNYLIGQDAKPYLIDPSVYRGDGMVDIAMARLFGGFGEAFFDAYKERFDPGPFQQERIELYQLYYLLVHLNLFGPSYKRSVINITRTYFF